MFSLTMIRDTPDRVREGIIAKGETVDIDAILQLDEKHRALQTEINSMRAERNQTSESIGKIKRAGGDAQEAIQAMGKLGGAIKQKEKEWQAIKSELDVALLQIPNMPHESVPRGKDEQDNVTVRTWGDLPAFDFEPKTHLALGTLHQLFDFERASRVSGSGFPLYTGVGAKLERALINYMLDFHVKEYGFRELFPPFVVRQPAMQTTGQLPKFAEDMYHTDVDDLYLIPTAEVPITNIHREEILDEADLPIQYAAYSACFRREAGSYGKETRGFLRLHQFNKVELVKFTRPEESYQEHETLTRQAEAILQNLGLHYRVLELCTGDLSFAAAKCYDLEVWAPGEKQWLEVSSCSNFEEFQARRGNIRYRRESDQKVEFVHTLNGSGVATPRLLVALLETYQQADGRILIPDVLQPYLHLEVIE